MAIDNGNVRGLKPGDLFTKDGEDVWEVMALYIEPSLIMRNVRDHDQTEHFAIGGTMADSYTQLVPVEPIKGNIFSLKIRRCTCKATNCKWQWDGSATAQCETHRTDEEHFGCGTLHSAPFCTADLP